jgi:hypothetical protein
VSPPVEDDESVAAEEPLALLEDGVVVVEDESHFGAPSSSVFGCDEASLACFGDPPHATSANAVSPTKTVFFTSRIRSV